MALLAANLFTYNIGINVSSLWDHKTKIEYTITTVEDRLNRSDYDEELVYNLDCLYNYLNDPTVWITGDMVDDAYDCYSDSDCCCSDYADYS